jgi:hypothetical protein
MLATPIWIFGVNAELAEALHPLPLWRTRQLLTNAYICVSIVAQLRQTSVFLG